MENYFVKSLIGWTAKDGAITERHLVDAMRIVSQFDVILLTEHMESSNTSRLLEHTFRSPDQAGRHKQAAGNGLQEKVNKVDKKEVQRLQTLLANDKVSTPLTPSYHDN